MHANYVDIQDSRTTLPGSNGDIDFTTRTFDTSNLDVNRRPVLYCRVNDSGGSVSLRIDLNGTTIATGTFGADVDRSLVEIVDAGLLWSRNNTLTITRTAGPGSFTISGLVMIYGTTD